MTTILVIGAFQALFFAALLIVKRRRSICDSVMAMWLVLLFTHLLIIYCKHLGLYEDFPHLIGSTSSLIFLYGPLLFFYVDNYISNFPGFKKSYYIHLIPFVVYNIYRIPFYVLNANEKIQIYEAVEVSYSLIDIMFYLLKVAVIPFYVILILVSLRKHRGNLAFYFSNFDKKDLQWVQYLVWSISAVGVMVIFTGIAKVGHNSILSADSEQYVLVATTFWIFGLGFYAVKQTSIFVDVSYDPKRSMVVPATDPMQEYKSKRLKKFQEESFETKLKSYLSNEKPYLKSRLTIDELAESLEVTAHDLSLFINDQLKQSFFDLVNSYRVQEFINNMQDPSQKNYTLLGIAMDSGFNSKASLNRIFKKHTGKSPTEYLKNVSN